MNAVQGMAEISVQGDWSLDIIVSGPEGQAEAFVPIAATAAPDFATIVCDVYAQFEEGRNASSSFLF